ncbi:SLAP domain-containing protein [Bombilactobacillus bombi]|nr:SLAP domain-containing protein [Bombilactobacillus bombi]
MFKKNKKLVLTSLAAIALLTTGGLASSTTQVVNAAIDTATGTSIGKPDSSKEFVPGPNYDPESDDISEVPDTGATAAVATSDNIDNNYIDDVPETHPVTDTHEGEDITIVGMDDDTSKDGIIHHNPDGTDEVVSFRGVVKTNKDNAQLYAINGDTVTKTDRFLALNTPWRSDKSKTIAGVVYYRVSTNEWIKSADVSISGQSIGQHVIKVMLKSGSQVYNIKNNMLTLSGRVLAARTPWLTTSAIIIDGKVYYQVSPNEWLDADSMSVVLR